VWSLWGADLSPFALKVEALLRFAGVPFRWLPASGSALESHRFNLRRARLIAGRLPLLWIAALLSACAGAIFIGAMPYHISDIRANFRKARKVLACRDAAKQG